MTSRANPSRWQTAAAALATIVTLIPLVPGVWLLLYCFVLPRQRGSGGPGSLGDIEGALVFWGGAIATGISLPFVVCTAAAWLRRRWGHVGVAALCGTQLLLHVVILVKWLPTIGLIGGMLAVGLFVGYTALLAVGARLAVAAAAATIATPDRTRGFAVLAARAA